MALTISSSFPMPAMIDTSTNDTSTIDTSTNDTYTNSKNKYLFTRLLINKIIQHEGAVFGGAVRDHILHRYHADQFYKKYDAALYNDPKVAPELSERFLVPKDIDFMIKIEKVDDFMKTLYKMGCFINILKKDLSYFTLVEPGEYQLRKLQVCFNNQLISLDMVVCFGEFVFPPMNHDFDVNQLVQKYKITTKNGNANSKEICLQIEKKIATCTSDIPQYRIENMISKGWIVVIHYYTLKFQIRTNEMIEHCVICMDDLEVGRLEVKEKNCCNYSYCKKCLHHSLKLNCLMCKKEVDKVQREMDITCFEEFGILG
jgi:hypothetical protein